MLEGDGGGSDCRLRGSGCGREKLRDFYVTRPGRSVRGRQRWMVWSVLRQVEEIVRDGE